MNTNNIGRRLTRALAAAAAAAVPLTGCDVFVDHPELAGQHAPAPSVSEDADGTTYINETIWKKNYSPLGSWAGQTAPRWEFCFEFTNGDWTCVPVSATDYKRFNVGDRIVLHQHVGELADIDSAGR